MSVKENILNAIRGNQPSLVPLPKINLNKVIHFEDTYLQFKTVLQNIGGVAKMANSLREIKKQIEIDKINNFFIIDLLSTISDEDRQKVTMPASELEKLEKVYIKASIAVAENGAVWITESQMQNRLLPFISQQLILVIDKDDIVDTMHDAYNKIDTTNGEFGVFIAGPSKTADIEQSLVIGAHGARTTTVYVIDKNE
jgi:L-lactate dehydrogenase complex protein LldG